jgi:hypothetical protein
VSTTTGELYLRAKALGLKGAGGIEPIARAAYEAHRDEATLPGQYLVPWDQVGVYARQGWRSAVLAALEVLPEPTPAPAPADGLKPGDVVSVRGVVHELDDPRPYVSVKIDGYRGASLGASGWMDLAHVTFVERPAPPEPDWQPGDLAEDDNGVRYAYADPGSLVPWLDVTDGNSWFGRDEIPGPLHKLTVTREDAP